MRIGFCVWACLALLGLAAPARAQFAAPFGAPGVLSVPEAASGAFGAGAAHSAATQQGCTQGTGRDGPRAYCQPSAEAPAPRRR